jgi:hypothetical protein
MLVRSGRAVFESPASFGGVYINQTGNVISAGGSNRFVGGLSAIFGAYPSGNLSPSAFIMPQKNGGLSSFTSAAGAISPTATLIPARNLVGSAAMVITLTNAQLDQIVSAVASGALSISVLQAILAGAANAIASGSGVISVDSALCGAIFSVTATTSGVASGTGSTLTAKANLSADAGGPTPLSPEGLANAVLDALLADHVDAGTVGEALNSIGAAGNPWSADLTTNNDPGTFGERVQKLLKKAEFLGLK